MFHVKHWIDAQCTYVLENTDLSTAFPQGYPQSATTYAQLVQCGALRVVQYPLLLPLLPSVLKAPAVALPTTSAFSTEVLCRAAWAGNCARVRAAPEGSWHGFSRARGSGARAPRLAPQVLRTFPHQTAC